MFSISISWNIGISLNITESSSISFLKTYEYIISMNTSPKHMYHRNQSSWAISCTISQTVVVSPKNVRESKDVKRFQGLTTGNEGWKSCTWLCFCLVSICATTGVARKTELLLSSEPSIIVPVIFNFFCFCN